MPLRLAVLFVVDDAIVMLRDIAATTETALANGGGTAGSRDALTFTPSISMTRPRWSRSSSRCSSWVACRRVVSMSFPIVIACPSFLSARIQLTLDAVLCADSCGPPRAHNSGMFSREPWSGIAALPWVSISDSRDGCFGPSRLTVRSDAPHYRARTVLFYVIRQGLLPYRGHRLHRRRETGNPRRIRPMGHGGQSESKSMPSSGPIHMSWPKHGGRPSAEPIGINERRPVNSSSRRARSSAHRVGHS